MSKYSRLPEPPGTCLYHRCADHDDVPQLNTTEPSGAECGACLAYDTYLLMNRVLPDVLDGYALYLEQHRRLAQQLTDAYARLNFVSPGAGDGLRREQLAAEMKRMAARGQADADDRLRALPPEGSVS